LCSGIQCVEARHRNRFFCSQDNYSLMFFIKTVETELPPSNNRTPKRSHNLSRFAVSGRTFLEFIVAITLGVIESAYWEREPIPRVWLAWSFLRLTWGPVQVHYVNTVGLHLKLTHAPVTTDVDDLSLVTLVVLTTVIPSAEDRSAYTSMKVTLFNNYNTDKKRL